MRHTPQSGTELDDGICHQDNGGAGSTNTIGAFSAGPQLNSTVYDPGGVSYGANGPGGSATWPEGAKGTAEDESVEAIAPENF